MDRVKEIFGAEIVKNSDPRVVEGRLYQDPIDVCYRIDDIIFKILSSGKEISDELQEQCLAAIDHSGSVRDSSYIKINSSGHMDNSKTILSLVKGLERLIGNDDFLRNFDSLSFKEARSDYSWSGNNFQDIRSKDELKKIIKEYIDLLNYFALKSYPAARKMRH